MGLAAPPTTKAISISPLNKRRWENFKANRRGYWALWIFLTLFVISLFAEFIANDKPIFI
ncbi:MAG: ABC transporter permease, partial [Pseudolabrys sp.]